MAKKADLLAQAQALGLELTDKNTVAEIEAAINQASSSAETEAPVVEEEKPVAKAGKRSEKSLREAEEKADKEARKEAGDTTPQSEEAEAHIKKGPAPKTRSKLERRGKKYQEAAKKVEADKAYPLAEALKLATETNPAKFDASVEVHVRMGVDPRQADQNIRATVSLPNGSGKAVRVAAFVPSEEVEAAKKAGADVAGEDAVTALL
ncbi:MAG TPA: 50S ribosomal protein L1, partial [Candidatus Saccharimonadales bacterium]|nr:50S ribosomal protein L1 [Candidatus Saccharimonadales bacterium]